MKSPDWIVVNDGTHRTHPYALRCLRCGAVQPVALPISVTGYCALGKVFEREHRRCLPAEPQKQGGRDA